jgi:hypothetical protein
VCAENFIRIDLVTESHNVGHDGRADISLLELGCLGRRKGRRGIAYDGCGLIRRHLTLLPFELVENCATSREAAVAELPRLCNLL